MKAILPLFFSLAIFNNAIAQSFAGLSVHNNQYSFLPSMVNNSSNMRYSEEKNDVINASILFRQQLFKYLDICMEIGYEKVNLEYSVGLVGVPNNWRDKYISKPNHLIMPVYLQPKFRFKNIAAHLNVGIAPQYILSHKIHVQASLDETTVITDLDDRFNYSFITGGGIDYYIKNRWLASVNYFTGNTKKEWNSFGGFRTESNTTLYKNDRISVSIAYNLSKRKK